MFSTDDWWSQQLFDWAKEIAAVYEQFSITRDIEDYEKAEILNEKLNKAYDLSLNLLKTVEIGKACLPKQALPHTLE